MPSIPPHVELIIERAMAKNPDDRYPDMVAFEQALDALPNLKSWPDESPAQALAAPAQSIKRPTQLSESDADVHAARPRLLLALLAAVLLLIAALTIAISGVELASGYTFGTVELRLILLCIVGSAATPFVLWILHIRKRIWTSSSRVLALLGQVRAAVLAGVISYGLLVLLFHVVDDFLVRFLGRADVKPVGATWTGWNLLLPAVSLVTAVAVAERRRLLLSVPPGWRRLLVVWLVGGIALGTVSGLVYLGLIWRAASTH
jgi:serine/threonine-protein kinase